MRIAVITSRFNAEITGGLRLGAKECLLENGIPENAIDFYDSPGVFEIPLLAQTLAQSKKYSGIVCLGAVIKGETAHFEFISLGATIGLMQAMLNTSVPISFGILTTYTDEQAQSRSNVGASNKGREAAAACLESIRTLERATKSPS